MEVTHPEPIAGRKANTLQRCLTSTLKHGVVAALEDRFRITNWKGLEISLYVLRILICVGWTHPVPLIQFMYSTARVLSPLTPLIGHRLLTGIREDIRSESPRSSTLIHFLRKVV